VKHVLLAEDDPDAATAIKATLEECLQITVDHMTNGALVLDQITARHPEAGTGPARPVWVLARGLLGL
jgi:CheY-like chemotaxis protein